MGILVQQGFTGHDPAVQTISALRGLFINEGLLNAMRIFGSSQTIESDDFLAKRAGNRVETGADGAIIDEHSASAALPQPAAEPGIVEGQGVSKDVEKGALGIHVDGMNFTVYFD